MSNSRLYKQEIQTTKINFLNSKQTAFSISLTVIFQIVYIVCFLIITNTIQDYSCKLFLRCIFGTGGCKITQQNRTNCKLCRYQVVKIYNPGENRQVERGLARKNENVIQIHIFKKQKLSAIFKLNIDNGTLIILLLEFNRDSRTQKSTYFYSHFQMCQK